MTYETIEIEQDGPWRTLWLNRPDARNALSREMAAELRDAFAALAQSDARGLTVRGRGGTFCAGGDLKGFKQALAGGMDLAEADRMSREGGALFDACDALPFPVIMVVEGAAMAGGLGLACTGDVVLAAEDARFALTETTLGISPAQIAPFVLRRLGPVAGRRLMLTAARFDGAEAARLGLADFVAPAAALDGAEAAIRRQVMACAPHAVAETKALLRDLPLLSRAQQIERAAAGFAELLLSPEAREGLTAFAEKRKPRWAEE
jgi:isohexenylglutaconyl-CoA hydratase